MKPETNDRRQPSRSLIQNTGFRCLFVVLVFFVVEGVYSLPEASMLPENTETRRQYRDVLSSSVTQAIESVTRDEVDPVSGVRVRFDIAEQNEAIYYLFLNQMRGEYPVASAGNWIIKRSAADGLYVQAKVFLQESNGTFVRLFPAGSTSRMDVYLEGIRIHRQVPVRISFDDLMVSSFERVIELTRFRVDWSILLPQAQRSDDVAVAKLSGLVRGQLDRLVDSDDGALDSDGVYRFIEDLTENPATGFNCSGFAKWIVDGLVYPISGEYLTIQEMKAKHFGIRGNAWTDVLEDSRDPFFGLDWTRNLAVAVEARRYVETPHVESADVRSVRSYDYIEDIGYEIAELPAVLYYLALDNPGRLYLGSVNQPFGTAPILRQHVHVVVIFPYFDERGVFRADIMERNVETSVESLVTRYPHDHIHLVEIPVDGRFQPPGL